MKASDNCINLIKQFEGLRLKAYQCPAGVMTIGFGSTRWTDGKPIKATDIIDEATAKILLQHDLQKFEDAVNKLVSARINQRQFDALVCFVYNIGEYAFKNSTMLKLLNAGKYDEAAQQFLRWTKANNKELAGLVKRRQAEKDLFLS